MKTLVKSLGPAQTKSGLGPEYSCIVSIIGLGWLQGLLLTTYLKFLIADPDDANLKALAEEVFNKYSR